MWRRVFCNLGSDPRRIRYRGMDRPAVSKPAETAVFLGFRPCAEVDFNFLGTVGTMNMVSKQHHKITRLPSKKAPARRNQIKRSSRTKGLAGESGPLKSTFHRFHTVLLAAYVLAIIWTSLAYAAEYRITGSPSSGSVALLKATSTPHGRLYVRAYIQSAAKAAGVNPRIAEWIVSHESQHHPEATGDGGESRGLWQINKAWHPEVSDACAYDVTCSTDWSLERIRAGYVDEWSTWKYCKSWFEDCPF